MKSWYVMFQETGINDHWKGQQEPRELLFLIYFDRIADAQLHQFGPDAWPITSIFIGRFHFGGDGEVQVEGR